MKTRERGADLVIDQAAWLFTLNDLLFLLLTFFVLFFSTLDFSPFITESPTSAPIHSSAALHADTQKMKRAVIDALGEANELSAQEIQFSSGATLIANQESFTLSLPNPFLEDEDLPFRTVALLRVAAKLAQDGNYFIELQVRAGKDSPARARKMTLSCLRQILDANLAPTSISAYGQRTASSQEGERMELKLVRAVAASNRG